MSETGYVAPKSHMDSSTCDRVLVQNLERGQDSHFYQTLLREFRLLTVLSEIVWETGMVTLSS